MHYLFPTWPAPSSVKACTTLRFGGYSPPPFDSFNFKNQPDIADTVIANRKLLMNELQLPQQPTWLKQVHGTKVVQADQISPLDIPEADASYTCTPGVVCSILTADCIPVLVCNQQGTKVAAIHAGWRGLSAGVIEATINKLQPAEDLIAWLGPAIGPKFFEVGEEVRREFMQSDSQATLAFKPHSDHTWLADIYMLAKQRLNSCGVTRIFGGEFCTYSDPTRFYSYRRDQGKTGGMASLIWLF
jgi:polyphenol oxidase